MEDRSMTGRRSLAAGLVLGVLAVLLTAGGAHALAVGEKAPDFTLPKVADRNAAPVKLSELTAKGPVVLYTFIQAFTAT
jgi:hypothetical protein